MHRARGPDPLLSGLQQTGDGGRPRTAPRHRQVQEGQRQLARHLHVLKVWELTQIVHSALLVSVKN